MTEQKKRKQALFAVGHMSIAYLLGMVSGKALHLKPNIPLLMVLSILPDIDIVYELLTGASFHRGPTHSLIIAVIAFIPVFVIYRKKAIPYFLALISHSLIGDFIIGGQMRLLWPISTSEYGLHELGGPHIDIFSPINIALEMSFFLVAMLVLYKSGDWRVFFTPSKMNLILIIPVTTVLLPSTIGYPFSTSLILSVPPLALAHMVYLVLFSIAILTTLATYYKKWFTKTNVQLTHEYTNRSLQA